MESPRLLSDIPGLTRALERARRAEDRIRELAFLPVNEQINGVEVKQLTPRHLTILFAVRSPFLYGGVRQIEDVGLFLWIVSPHYSATDNALRAEYMAQLVQHPRWTLFYRGIDRYLKRALMDKPAASSHGVKMQTSFAAGIVDKIMAGGYTFSQEEILNTPIARLYQYMRYIDTRENPRKPQISAICDGITRRFVEKYT